MPNNCQHEKVLVPIAKQHATLDVCQWAGGRHCWETLFARFSFSFFPAQNTLMLLLYLFINSLCVGFVRCRLSRAEPRQVMEQEQCRIAWCIIELLNGYKLQLNAWMGMGMWHVTTKRVHVLHYYIFEITMWVILVFYGKYRIFQIISREEFHLFYNRYLRKGLRIYFWGR